jgi:hypothetical protein
MCHISVLEIPPTQCWSREKIIVWLKDERIHSPEESFKVELLNLIIAIVPKKRMM